MQSVLLKAFTCVLAFYLAGCSYQTSVAQREQIEIPFNFDLFQTDKISIISEQSLFELTPKQQAKFLAFFERKVLTGKLKHEAISDYLLQHLNNFTYYGDTLTAQEAFEQNKGNCMSLAILTTALAKLVGVESGYREVITSPVYEKHNNLILSSIHVQTKLFDPSTNDGVIKNVALREGISIDYFPASGNIKSKFIHYPQFIAMYFKNVASDALIKGDFNKAFAYAERAYQYDGGNPEVLNLLAVIHRRAGDSITAEAIYQRARANDDDNLSLLSNYITLLENQQRHLEAVNLRQKIRRIEDPNPYIWLEQAYMAHNAGQLKQAEYYYEKTLALAPYVSQAYRGLYQIYMGKDQVHRAKATLAQALEWTHGTLERQQLKYKLYGRNNTLELTR